MNDDRTCTRAEPERPPRLQQLRHPLQPVPWPLVFAVALVVLVALLAVISLSDAAGSRSREPAGWPTRTTQVHPQCQAPYTLLGSSSVQDEGRVELTARLLATGGCRWDSGPPPRNGAVRVRRCGAASQSGMYAPGEPSLAIDGSYAREMDDVPACSHTDLEPSGSWWQVDLNAPAEVESVQMWGRTVCCPERLGWASVVVSTTPDFTDNGFVCHGTTGNFFQGDRSETFDCSHAIGQYITVTLANPLGGPPVSGGTYITICELDAWGRFLVTGGTGHRDMAQNTSGIEFQHSESICASRTTDARWRELRRVLGTPPPAALQLYHGFELARSCGHSDVNITDGAWYRFAGVYDALPTEPVRLFFGGDGFSCGALSSAWVSGWDPSLSVAPPFDYSQPGAYPGQGPQYIDSDVQQRVLCFEGWWPPSSASDEGGDAQWQYRSCGESTRVAIVHCGTFLLWQLPPPPSVVEPMPPNEHARTKPSQGYCTVPSGIFGGELPFPRWHRERG